MSYREILEIDPASTRRCRRSTPCTSASRCGPSWPTTSAVSSTWRKTPARADRLMLGSRAARARAWARSKPRSRSTARCCRDPTNAEALAALERLMQQPEHERAIAEILEPLYRDAGEVAKLIGVHEIQARHASSAEQKCPAARTMAELYETQLDDLRSAVEPTRARSPKTRATSTQEQLERVAPRPTMRQSWPRSTSRKFAQGDGPAGRRLLHVEGRRRSARTCSATCSGAIAHYRKVLEHDAQPPRGRQRTRAPVPAERAYEALAGIYLVKSRCSPIRGPEAVPLPRPRQILRGGAQPAPARGRRVQAGPRARRPKTWHFARQAQSSSYSEARALGRLARPPTPRKADIVSSPEDKKAITPRLAPSTSASSTTRRRAIDTYQRILEVDPDDRSAIARLDALLSGDRELDRVDERAGARGGPHRRSLRVGRLSVTASPSSGIRSSATPRVRSKVSGKSWSSRPITTAT